MSSLLDGRWGSFGEPLLALLHVFVEQQGHVLDHEGQHDPREELRRVSQLELDRLSDVRREGRVEGGRRRRHRRLGVLVQDLRLLEKPGQPLDVRRRRVEVFPVGDLVELASEPPAPRCHPAALFGHEALADTQLLAKVAHDAVAHAHKLLQLRRPRLALAPPDAPDAQRHPAAHVPRAEVLRAPVLHLLERGEQHLDDADLFGHVAQLHAALRPHLLRDVQPPRDVPARLGGHRQPQERHHVVWLAQGVWRREGR